MHEIDSGHGFEQFAGHVIGRALSGRRIVQLAGLRFGQRDEFLQRLCLDGGMDHDHEVGVVDRRDRCEIAHQLVFALRHQRFIGGLGVRHHQQRVAVRRRFGGLDRADDAAGTGAILDHEGLAETLLQHAADLAGGDVGRATGAERDDHPDRAGGIVLRQTRCCQNGPEQRCRQRNRQSKAHHLDLPVTRLVLLAVAGPIWLSGQTLAIRTITASPLKMGNSSCGRQLPSATQIEL